MMAAARFYKHLPDVLTSEALAARDGVMLAQELGVEQLILELDNSTLVALLRSEDGAVVLSQVFGKKSGSVEGFSILLIFLL